MAARSGNAGPVEAPETTTHPLDPWGLWIVRWLGAMLTVTLLGVSLLLVFEWGGLSVGWMVVFALPIAFVVAVLTFVAAVLRWALSRFAPPRLQDAVLPVVALGMLGVAIPMWLYYFGDDLAAGASPSAEVMLGLVGPAAVGGGVASYLAERQVSVRRPGWWVATIGAAVGGALVRVGGLG